MKPYEKDAAFGVDRLRGPRVGDLSFRVRVEGLGFKFQSLGSRAGADTYWGSRTGSR